VQSGTRSCGRIRIATADPARMRSAMRSSRVRGARWRIGARLTAACGRGELSAERDDVDRAGTCNAQILAFYITIHPPVVPALPLRPIPHSPIPTQKGHGCPRAFCPDWMARGPLNHSNSIPVAPKGPPASPIPQKVPAKSGVPQKYYRWSPPSKSINDLDPSEE
jgi:hypothetical protein